MHLAARFPERSASPILTALSEERRFTPSDRYFVSKLLDVFLTRELAKSDELKDIGIIVCFVNPEFCRSELLRGRPRSFQE